MLKECLTEEVIGELDKVKEDLTTTSKHLTIHPPAKVSNTGRVVDVEERL